MSKSSEHIDPIRPPIRTNKNFVYKGKKYPIDFSLVKKYSNYFYINRKNYKSQDDIELKALDYIITDESIPTFIACCQNEPFDINDDNIFSLHQLSIQYDVPILINLTKQYIEKNPKHIIFESILFKLQNHHTNVNFDLTNLEDIVASNFFEYINDERLLTLPINVLYRIINKEQLNINSMNLTNQGQFIEFLFKCLEKYQREASILFQNLDMENERLGVINRELQKQKIELANKISEIESDHQKQRDFFASAQTEFNQSKSDLLNSNHILEEKVTNLETKLNQLEQELSQQAELIRKYTKVKVGIECESKYLGLGSTFTLKASVNPEFTCVNGVEWQIIQDPEGSISVESKDDKKLTLKCLRAFKKVTVVAKANDGNYVSEMKEIEFSRLNARIEIDVKQDQSFKGRIKIEEEKGSTLDRSKSKYLLNKSSSQILGESAYKDGFTLDSLDKEVSFRRIKGDYYLHVLVVESNGIKQEMVSQKLQTNGITFCYGPAGSVQSVELDAGKYKLEALGAQGGSFDSTYHGGYGGYSTGTINLSSKTTIFVVVGKSTNSEAGGYNGGGCGGPYKQGTMISTFGGGGASHIGLKSGELKSFNGDFQRNLLIVAGGGGGCVGSSHQDYKKYNDVGGCGGGCIGADGKSKSLPDRVGSGGSQTSGGKNNYEDWDECGSFGQGSNCKDHRDLHLGSGGGGGFYGGGSGGNTAPGGGGSGFINTAKLTDAFMYGYEVPTSSSVESKTFSTTNVSSDPISNYAKRNDGYVKITLL